MDAASDPSGTAAEQARDAQAAQLERVRGAMVDSQVRPNRVTDPRILNAMRRLPREAFLPPACRHLAYLDADVRLPSGRAMLAPMTIARLVQVLSAASGERGLVVGAGAGYAACLLAACGVAVTALEEDRQLLDIGRDVLARLSPGLVPGFALVEGPLAEGWPAAAPYDLILLEGAVTEIPASLAAQLVPRTGRLATILALPARTPSRGVVEARAVLAEATPAGLHPQPAFDCTAPLIPSLRPPPRFTF